MSTYEYARLQAQQAAQATYNTYNPNLTQGPPHQNQPRIPGNNHTGEHRVKKVVKVWTCAKQHPTAALLTLRPDIKFEETFNCQTKEGAAMIYKVAVDGVVYQGAGTKSTIAKGIAAYNALVGIKANGVQFLTPICDIKAEEQMVTRRLALHEEMSKAKAAAAKEKENNKEQNLKKQLKEIRDETGGAPKKTKANNGQSKGAGNMAYGEVLQKYGPDVEVVYEELQKPKKAEAEHFVHQCTLKVQGFTFLAQAGTKKGACALAAGEALERFLQDPPPHVNERKRKVPTPFVPKEPIDFPDKLAAFCWSFVDTLTSKKPAPQVKRRNLVCIVKVVGSANEIEKCSVVAVGSGTLVVDKANMKTDGSAINDSTGEALAARAFRTYILCQVNKLASRQTSIFTKDRQGKIFLKKDVRFLMYTNSCPMGDARYFGIVQSLEPPKPTEGEPMEVETSTKTETPATAPAKSRPWFKRREVVIKEEDKGKVQVFKAKPQTDGKSANVESTVIPSSDSTEQHSIKSPSDKLLLRNMTGFQGALNSTLCPPIYISEYYIGRAYDEEAVKRGLYGRAEGASKLQGPSPAVYQVTWKAEKMAQPCSEYSFVWCEGEQLDIIKSHTGLSVQTAGELVSESPSLYCTANFYKVFTEVCKTMKKTAGKSYVEGKVASERYQLIKRSVFNKLELEGKGQFPQKAIKPNF